MNIDKRYDMNVGVLTEEAIHRLNDITVLVVGLGGLGGNVVNQLVRLGVKNFILVDFDRFTESNLNRQLFSNTDSIGRLKVEVVSRELKMIHPLLQISKYASKIQDIEVSEIDYIIDCVDNIETKVYLSKLSSKTEKYLLHGSCGGWYGQVGWQSPRSTLIEDMYQSGEGLEKELLNPPFTPSAVASIMVSEFAKFILNDKNTVVDDILLIDLLHNEIRRVKG